MAGKAMLTIVESRKARKAPKATPAAPPSTRAGGV
jgi:hypothetical protein